MQLTVLGRSAPFPPAGGAGPAYLVEGGGTSLLLDGGSGTLARLQQRLDAGRLGAVLVSHLHEDHIADLYGLQFVAWEALKAGRRTEPLPIYAPEAPADVRRWLRPAFDGAIDLRPLPVAAGLTLAGLACRFARTDHPIPCWAMRITDGQRVLVYTGDTGVGTDLAPFAAGADLLLAEATYSEATGQARAAFGHMTGAEAAQLARRAGVGRLLLTHLNPTADAAAVLAEARAIFPAAELAAEMVTHRLD